MSVENTSPCSARPSAKAFISPQKLRKSALVEVVFLPSQSRLNPVHPSVFAICTTEATYGAGFLLAACQSSRPITGWNSIFCLAASACENRFWGGG